jgi:outer membrane protein TolC
VCSAFREAETEYRARRIDDEQYLAARRLFDAASKALDDAESAFLDPKETH